MILHDDTYTIHVILEAGKEEKEHGEGYPHAAFIFASRPAQPSRRRSLVLVSDHFQRSADVWGSNVTCRSTETHQYY